MSKKTTNYWITSSDNTTDLCGKVQAMIRNGWTITGMPFYAEGCFHQAMVKLELEATKGGRR